MPRIDAEIVPLINKNGAMSHALSPKITSRANINCARLLDKEPITLNPISEMVFLQILFSINIAKTLVKELTSENKKTYEKSVP